ncbi:DUF5684 domain-containing protein [uncultured Dubosiella sp.]|uniref:DUF5684 domain-containing protein n=1 Tax=uncultured Dubosiella sp. TaxID=1937011 RepID=UPI00207E1164|nr:DUF5684 domain-containing protein [uncultured Dubosiella sp.]GJM57073.1 hypothetical protein EROP_07660 [Erysipelotrichaceae bacterium OPF54]
MFFTTFNMGYGVLALVWYIFVAIGAWKMFDKAGEAGWKALIPLYNLYIAFKISWQGMYFWIWLALTVVSGFMGASASDANGFMYYAAWIIGFVQLLILCNLAFKLSASYGHGMWFALGLYFFPFLFTLILGFGSSQYVGNRAYY